MNRLAVLLIVTLVVGAPFQAYTCDEPSTGQTIYVPAYSHIYYGNNEDPFKLTVTLSIRNVDPERSIEIQAIDYYETQGRLMKKELQSPRSLGPFGSMRFVVPHNDKTGGSGANFIVKWTSSEPVSPPIVETIMIGTQQQQGISFTSRGRAIVTRE